MTKSILKTLILSTSLMAIPSLASPPDGLLTSKAKLSLWTTAGIRSTTVHVDTTDGVITLYGKVPNAEQKGLAEKTARDIVGVRSVTNLLQVVAEAQEKAVERSDKDTQALAVKSLKADVALRDSKISVKSVDKGVVLLTGEASTLSDHLRAVVIVDRLAGVRRVVSEIKAPEAFGGDERVTFLSKPSARMHSSANDMRMTAEVKLRLLTAAEIPSTEISVDTEDNSVTLFGIVPTDEVKKAAGVEAGKVSGVGRVLNQLEVVASNQKAFVEAKDDDITRSLALMFKDRPELKAVATSVKNGIVRLTGSVMSGWDEMTAVRLARLTSGVRGVDVQIKIEADADATPRY